jgi:hypothetical protein
MLNPHVPVIFGAAMIPISLDVGLGSFITREEMPRL